MDETYAPVVRMRYDMASGDPEKAQNARRHLGPGVQLGRWKFVWINLSRPIILLTRSFICFILNLYMALIYGIYYLMFATFSGMCYPPTRPCPVSHVKLHQNSSPVLMGSVLGLPVLLISDWALDSSPLPWLVCSSRIGSTPTIERKTMGSESLRCEFLP
jgi:hypothetical protein